MSWEASCWCGARFKAPSESAARGKWERHFDERQELPLHERGVHALALLEQATSSKAPAKTPAKAKSRSR